MKFRVKIIRAEFVVRCQRVATGLPLPRDHDHYRQREISAKPACCSDMKIYTN